MDFLHPLVLLAIPPLGWAIYRTGRGRLRRLPWLRALVTLFLRLLISLLLIVALAGPRVSRAASGVHVVFLLDRSDSVGTAGWRSAATWVQAALRGMHADDSAAALAFGSAPASPDSVGPGTTLPTMSAVNPQATNIEAALRLALGTLPPDQPTRLVLLSDGRQTQGDALAAAQQAASDGVPLAVVPLATKPPNDVSVASVDLPHYARKGEDITLRISILSQRPTDARVRIAVDSTLLGEQALHLQAGLNTFFFAQSAGGVGTHAYRVQVKARDDAIPQNDTLDAVSVVQPAARVLMLTQSPAEAAPLLATLTTAGLQVTIGSAQQAPTSAAAMEAYDAVVLADMPAGALSEATVAALQSAVHDRGRGLLVTGGPQSFATGGYSGSKLETLLPVTSLAVAHAGRGQVGLILIIDKSGSMMDEVHGVSKISMAQQAAIDAVAHLRPTDEFGVLAFDDTTHVVAPYGPVGARANQARTRASIVGLQAFGDTVIYPALRQAARWLFNSHAQFKHIVLMTDGQGENAPFLKLIGQMKQNNITLSTIGIGSDAEQDELRGFANAGGGRFYYTADPHDIPRLVVLETRISSGPTRVEGSIGVRQAANAPALRSLVGQTLPSLHAYNITAPRDNAQILLQSPLGDPILAQWQYGLGRVATWTGGTAPDWARSWLGARAFWSDTLRWTMPAAGPQDLQPDLQVTNGMLQIGADAYTLQGGFANLLPTRARVTDPAGLSQPVVLAQDAPGHYSGSVSAGTPGVYRVQLAQYDGSTLLRQAPDAIAVPYPAEYAVGAPDLALLASLAAADNTPTLQHPGDAFSPAGLPARPVRQEVWPVLTLLALLLFPFDVAIRVLYTPPVPYDPRRHGIAD